MPSLTVSATVLNGPGVDNNGEVIATDTVDFIISVTAPAGFNSVLIGGSGNSVKTQNDAVIDELNYKFLKKSILKDQDESTRLLMQSFMNIKGIISDFQVVLQLKNILALQVFLSLTSYLLY